MRDGTPAASHRPPPPHAPWAPRPAVGSGASRSSAAAPAAWPRPPPAPPRRGRRPPLLRSWVWRRAVLRGEMGTPLPSSAHLGACVTPPPTASPQHPAGKGEHEIPHRSGWGEIWGCPRGQKPPPSGTHSPPTAGTWGLPWGQESTAAPNGTRAHPVPIHSTGRDSGQSTAQPPKSHPVGLTQAAGPEQPCSAGAEGRGSARSGAGGGHGRAGGGSGAPRGGRGGRRA